MRNIHTVLHKALADAAKGTVSERSCSRRSSSAHSARRPEMKVWDAKQLGQFLREIAGHRLYPAFTSSLTPGWPRRSARTPMESVDSARATLVSRSLVNVAYQPQLSDVKTNNGRTTIDLEPKTIAVLRVWKKRQIEERMLANLRPPADLIFAHPDGWL